MKVTKEHLQLMRVAIEKIDNPHWRKEWIKAYNMGAVRGDPNARYRWMLLHNAEDKGYLSIRLSTYYKTAHIETALKAIVPNLI